MKVKIEVPVEEWLKKEPKEGMYLVLTEFSDTLSYRHYSDISKLFTNYDGYNVTHVLVEVELSELIKEMMPSEEVEKLRYEDLINVNQLHERALRLIHTGLGLAAGLAFSGQSYSGAILTKSRSSGKPLLEEGCSPNTKYF